MQIGWIIQGLRTGVVTTRYPAAPEPQVPGWRGRPVLDPGACRVAEGCAACASVCLPEALAVRDEGRRLTLDYGRCIMCGLCVPACPAGALTMVPDYELAVRDRSDLTVTVERE